MARKQSKTCIKDPAHGKPYARDLCRVCYDDAYRRTKRRDRATSGGNRVLEQEMRRAAAGHDVLRAMRPMVRT